MKIVWKEIYQITRKGNKHLGGVLTPKLPRKGKTLYFLGHMYRVIKNERGKAYVKRIWSY